MSERKHNSAPRFQYNPNLPEDYIDYLREGLEQERDSIVDFIIKVDNVEIPCNTVVLRTQSHYFSRMFQHKDFKDVVDGCVKLKYLSSVAVQRVVDYMYSATIEFDSADMEDVLEVLNRMQITDDRLLAHITNYMIDNMNSANCMEWLICADMYNLPKLSDLKQRVHDTMKSYFTEVTEGRHFLELSYDQLSELFTRLIREHNAPRDKALMGAARWVMHETPSPRIKHFEAITQIINIDKCSEVGVNTFCKKYKDSLVLSSESLNERFGNINIDDLKTIIIACKENQSVGLREQVMILGGSLIPDEYNRKNWLFNVKTGESVEKASASFKHMFGTICNTPIGTIVAGGYSPDNMQGARRHAGTRLQYDCRRCAALYVSRR